MWKVDEENLKPTAPACFRNQQAIADGLQDILAERSTVLEIGSGTGQHAVFIAEQYPHLVWQPTELAESLDAIEQWRADSGLSNVLAAKLVDASQSDWSLGEGAVEDQYDAAFTANTIHFVSWQTVKGILAGVSQRLEAGSPFVVYGPFNRDEQYTGEGNKNLDTWLKGRDPESGIKDIKAFAEVALEYGLKFIKEEQMPANNLLLEFSKLP